MPTGHLGSMTFATTAISLNVIEIDPPEESINDIAVPHLGLAKGSYMPYEPGELIEGGEYTITLADDNNTHFVDVDSASSGSTFEKAIRVAQTITWTKPIAAGMSTAATRAFSGYVKSVKESSQKTGERNTITLKVKVAGNVTKTAGAA